MEIEITGFNENHRERLAQIYLEVRQTNFSWLDPESLIPSSFDQDTEGEFILVAKVDYKIVGFVSVWSKDNFIHHLYISNHFQNKGIGSRLLNSVINRANSDLTLKCLIKNRSALNFYLKQGWKPVSEGLSNEGEYILFKYLIPNSGEYP
nr:GNAT family N-acetyltransferase [Arenibacter sp. F20364]